MATRMAWLLSGAGRIVPCGGQLGFFQVIFVRDVRFGLHKACPFRGRCRKPARLFPLWDKGLMANKKPPLSQTQFRVLGQERPTFKFLNEPALLRCHPILAGFAPRPLVICQHIPALLTETLSVAPTAYAIKFTPYGLVCPQRPIPAHSCSAPLPPNAALSGKAGDRGGTYALSLVWQYFTPAVGWLSTRVKKKF